MKKPTLKICITALGETKLEIEKIPETIKILENYFDVSVWQDIEAKDRFGSQSIDQRLESLQWAFSDAGIVMPWKGGFNSVELLPFIKNLRINKKTTYVGLSDNTILTDALPAKGLCKGSQGPSLSNYFKSPENAGLYSKALKSLYIGDYNGLTKLYNQTGVKVLRSGVMTGKIWGGNNYSFDLLQGTGFWPSLEEPFVLFMEGEDILKDQQYVWRDFVRNIDSAMLQPGARQNITGLIIGKFPETYKLDINDIKAFVKARQWLNGLPIIYNFPCGHIESSLYLPLGENVQIQATAKNIIKMSKV